MPRINIYLNNKTYNVLNQLAAENEMKVSPYISKLISQAYDNNQKTIEEIESDIKSLKFSQNETEKNLTAIIESLNTYFKMFAGDDTNSAAFYPIDETPHPWVRKALELAESKIRMARYKKTIK